MFGRRQNVQEDNIPIGNVLHSYSSESVALKAIRYIFDIDVK